MFFHLLTYLFVKMNEQMTIVLETETSHVVSGTPITCTFLLSIYNFVSYMWLFARIYRVNK